MSTKSLLPFIGALLFGAGVLGGAAFLGQGDTDLRESATPKEPPIDLTSSSLKKGPAFVALLKADGRLKAAEAVSTACEQRWGECSCLQAQAVACLDAGFANEVRSLLSQDRECQGNARSQGMLAEALAREGQSATAGTLAQEVLRLNDDDPHAAFALAYLSRQKKEYPEMLAHTQAAIQRGRGASAHLFAFRFFLEQGQPGLARKEAETVLKLDPQDVDGLYNLAVLDQKEGRYREAREGYLQVARIAPAHADARFNLGVLTHSVGALAEASHNLKKLTQLVGPNDSRVKTLTELINGPPAPVSNRFVFKKGEEMPPGETQSPSRPSPVETDKPATGSGEGK